MSLLAAWRAEGERQLHDNAAAFAESLQQARTLAAAGRFDEAAAQATVAAYLAHRRHCGLFVSPDLEDLLMTIGDKTLAGPSGPRRRSTGIRNIVHVGTNMSLVSGNPRLVRRWIQQDSTRCSSLILTRQAPDPVPAELRAAVESSGGRITVLNETATRFVERARMLRRAAAGADVIVLHCWEMDVIPLIAFSDPCGLPPIVVVNHGDHWFWLGAAISDAVVNLRESGRKLTARRRGFDAARNLLLPTPLEPAKRTMSRTEAKRAIGVHLDSVVLLSIASAPKFKTVDGVSFAEAHVPVIANHPDAVLVVVGPAGREDWSAEIRATHGRIKVLPETSATSVYYQAADIYVDSFPFTSITSLLEAGSYGVPVVTRFPFPAESAILGPDAPGLTGTLKVTRSLDEYRAVLARWISDAEERSALGEATRASIESRHFGAHWEAALAATYESASRAAMNPRQPLSPACTRDGDSPDAFLPVIHGHTWSRDWIVRYVVGSMPFAGRWRVWKSLRATDTTLTTCECLLPEWINRHARRIRNVGERRGRRAWQTYLRGTKVGALVKSVCRRPSQPAAPPRPGLI
jgi:hypothetical protein